MIATPKAERVTALLLAKTPIAKIMVDEFAPDATRGEKSMVYRLRNKLIAERKLKESDNAMHGPGIRVRDIVAKPVIQFHPETKAFKIYALIQAGKTDAQILASTSYTKNDLYSVHHQIRQKIALGTPGKALVVHEAKAKALKAKKAKANGHALQLNGGGFAVPVVEAILHSPDGTEVRVFSSVDIFPAVFARAAKVTGFI